MLRDRRETGLETPPSILKPAGEKKSEGNVIILLPGQCYLALKKLSYLGKVILPGKCHLTWAMGIVGNAIYLPGQYYTEGGADKLASIPGAALEENLRKKSEEETKGLHSFETRVACAQKPGHKCHSSGGKGFGDPSQENVEHGPWRSQVRCCRKTKADSENLAPSFLPPSPAA